MNFYWKISKDYRSSECQIDDPPIKLATERGDNGVWGFIVLTEEEETWGEAPSRLEAQKAAEIEAGASVGWPNVAVDKEDGNTLTFCKNHGFVGDWSNVIESTYDLLRILEYCASDDMNYTPEAKEKIRELTNWIRDASEEEGLLTSASNLPV